MAKNKPSWSKENFFNPKAPSVLQLRTRLGKFDPTRINEEYLEALLGTDILGKYSYRAHFNGLLDAIRAGKGRRDLQESSVKELFSSDRNHKGSFGFVEITDFLKDKKLAEYTTLATAIHGQVSLDKKQMDEAIALLKDAKTTARTSGKAFELGRAISLAGAYMLGAVMVGTRTASSELIARASTIRAAPQTKAENIKSSAIEKKFVEGLRQAFKSRSVGAYISKGQNLTLARQVFWHMVLVPDARQSVTKFLAENAVRRFMPVRTGYLRDFTEVGTDAPSFHYGGNISYKIPAQRRMLLGMTSPFSGENLKQTVLKMHSNSIKHWNTHHVNRTHLTDAVFEQLFGVKLHVYPGSDAAEKSYKEAYNAG